MFSIPYWVRTYWAFEGIKDIQSTNQKMFFLWKWLLITRQRRLKARDSKNKQHLNCQLLSLDWMVDLIFCAMQFLLTIHFCLFVCMFVCFLVFCCINLTKLLRIRICTNIYIYTYACMHAYIIIYIHIYLHNAYVSSH